MSATLLQARPSWAENPAGGRAPEIVLAGFSPLEARAIASAWRTAMGEAEAIDLLFVASLGAALRELLYSAGPAPAALCCGPAVAGRELVRQLDELAAGSAFAGRLIVLGAGDDAEPFAPLVDEDRIFYLAARPPAPAEVVALLAAACGLSLQAAAESSEPAADEPPAEVLRRALEVERGRGLDEALDGVEQAAQKLVPARRASCRWVDAERWTLWRPGAGAGQEERDSAVSGLVGFVARTGRGVRLERIGEDPRYDAEVDHGRRSPRERFLAVALPAGPGARDKGAVEGVLCLARGEEQEPFEPDDLRRLEFFAREVGPILRRRRLAFELARKERETEVYRRQALDHREEGARMRQEPLRLAPGWIPVAYRSILALFVLGLLAIPFAGSDELAAGSAVVRLAERVEVRAGTSGVLETLSSLPGAAVRRGEELGRLESAEPRAALEQLRHELEERLAERLRQPHQAGADPAFATLRERHQLAAARLESLLLRAPRDGVLSAHLARPGQAVEAGQPVFSLKVDGVAARPSIEVLVPGRFRPLLQPGMQLRFEIDGYPEAPQELQVREIGQEVIGPERALAMFEGALGGGAAAEGMVLVRADLPAAGFDSDGRHFPYFDGMAGRAEIRVRQRRFLSEWLRRFDQ